MKYMIHATPTRLWYVEKYLIPSMMQQGIKFSEIDLYIDTNHDGNLQSCLKSFKSLPKDGDTWHLQDDVIISSDFAKRCYELELPFPEDIVCGFCSIYDKGEPGKIAVPVEDMWYSFQCIRINNKLAHEFCDWVQQKDDDNDGKYALQIGNNMFDDYLFKAFIIEKYPLILVTNLAPNLVDHIDYLIGGSTLVQRKEVMKSMYWDEPELIEKLKREIELS